MIKATNLSKADVTQLFQNAIKQNSIFEDIQVLDEPERLSGGVLNEVYAVKTDKGQIVIKWFSGEQLDPTACGTPHEIFQLQKHLFDHKVHVPEPLAFVEDLKGYNATLMQFVPGDLCETLNSEKALELGKLIANFHKASQDFKPFARQASDEKAFFLEVWQSIKRMWHFKRFRDEFEYLSTLIQYAVGTLQYPSDKNIPRGLLHGDVHTGNLKDSENGLCLLDYELSSKGLYIKDLANAICMFCLPCDNVEQNLYHFNDAIAKKILEGYTSIRCLSQSEVNYFPIALKDRIGLEKVGNMKLRNLDKPPGTNFNSDRAQVLSEYIKTKQLKALFADVKVGEDITSEFGERAETFTPLANQPKISGSPDNSSSTITKRKAIKYQ